MRIPIFLTILLSVRFRRFRVRIPIFLTILLSVRRSNREETGTLSAKTGYDRYLREVWALKASAGQKAQDEHQAALAYVRNRYQRIFYAHCAVSCFPKIDILRALRGELFS